MSSDRGPGAPTGNNNAAGNSGGGAPEGNQNAIGNNGGAPKGNTNAVGNSGGGAPEGNANARTHGLHVREDHHYENHASDREREAINETYVGLLDRYQHRHGEAPERAKTLMFRIAVNSLRELSVPDSTDPDAPPLLSWVEREDGDRELRFAPERRAKRRLPGISPAAYHELELLPPGEWSDERRERSRMRDVKPGERPGGADPLPSKAELEAKRVADWRGFLQSGSGEKDDPSPEDA